MSDGMSKVWKSVLGIRVVAPGTALSKNQGMMQKAVKFLSSIIKISGGLFHVTM
jgi:pyruvate/2-oxoglutarate/acetoin dehydrogenase E1 component